MLGQNLDAAEAGYHVATKTRRISAETTSATSAWGNGFPAVR